MSESLAARLAHTNRTAYQLFLEDEGLPVIQGFYIADLKTVPVVPWKRKGGLGTYVNLEGTGGVNDAYVAEIPPGGSLNAEKYLFEEMIYVLSGRGATTIWNEGGAKQTFEWQTGSLFSPPLNAWRQHFNGSGDQPARLLAVTNAPTMMDIIHNMDFIFNNPFAFTDRYDGEDGYFSAEGKALPGRVWDCNFIPDAPGIQLLEWKERGAGGRNICFEMANNTMGAHVSEFPVGTYKKGHRHGPGAHVIILSGEGYSLLWKEENDTKTRVNWGPGSVFVPPGMWFHQHFNVGPEPARYLALRYSGRKFRMGGDYDKGMIDKSLKEGGNQIEYDFEDPEIRKIFAAELARRGVEYKMQRFFPNG